MKTIFFCSIISWCAFSFATTTQLTGFYVSAGLGAGWSSASQKLFTEVHDTPTGPITAYGISNAIEVSGVSANVACGYALPYFSIEGKFTHVPDYIESDIAQLSQSGAFAGLVNSHAKSALDYVSAPLGIFKIPVYHFNLIAGSGLAIVFKRTHRRTDIVSFNGKVVEKIKQAGVNRTFYRPEIVAGISKDMNNHITCHVLYTRVFGKKNIGVIDAAKRFLPDINTLSFVVSYTL